MTVGIKATPSKEGEDASQMAAARLDSKEDRSMRKTINIGTRQQCQED